MNKTMSQVIRVLLVEDNPGDARLIQEMLAETAESGFEIVWVCQLSQGLESLAQEDFDVVLLDLGLPDSVGLDTFVQAYAQRPDLPFVVLTGFTDDSLGLSALRQGAQDYLNKGRVDAGLLCRAIRYAIERRRTQDALNAEHQRLFSLLDAVPAFIYLKAPDYAIRFANRNFREIFGPWEEKRCFEAVFGREEPCENCPSFVVLKTNSPQKWEWTRPGHGQTYQVYNYPFHDTDGSPLVLTLGIDITDRKQAEESLEASKRFLEISHRHSAMGPLLEEFADEIKRFTGCAAAAIRILGDSWTPPFVASVGLNSQFCELESLLATESDPCLCLKVLKETVDPGLPPYTKGGSFHTNHFSRLLEPLSREEREKLCHRHKELGFESLALVPLRPGPRALGLILAADESENMISPQKVEDLERAAVYLETSLEKLHAEENIHILSQELMRAQEHERQRISRALHDSVAQELAALKIGLENLRAGLAENTEAGQKLAELSEKLQKTLDSVRNLSYVLRPPDLEHFGLVQAIRLYCEEVAARTGLVIDFRAAGIEAVRLDYDTAINFYRIVREGLANVEKHARATKVIIRMVASFPKIILRLEDDGQGFVVGEQEAAAARGRRMGLLGMRERVALLKGQMSIESQPYKGTKISIEIPWDGESLVSQEKAHHC